MKRVVSVTCPHCSTRYDFSIELQRLRSMGLQAKCTRCDGSFDIVARLREQLARGTPQNVARIRPVSRPATPAGADEFAMPKDEVDIESLNEDDLLELDGDAEPVESRPAPPPLPSRDDGPPDLLALATDEAPPRPARRANPRRFSGAATVVTPPRDASSDDTSELSPAEMNALLEMARSLDLSDGDETPGSSAAVTDERSTEVELEAAFDRFQAEFEAPAVASPLEPDSSAPDDGSEVEVDLPEPDLPEPDLPEPDLPEPDWSASDANGADLPEPDLPEPDLPEPDWSASGAPEPDLPEPDLPEPDLPEPDWSAPDAAELAEPDLPAPDATMADAVIDEGPDPSATPYALETEATPSEPDAAVVRPDETSDASVMLAPDVDPSLPLELDDVPTEAPSPELVMQALSNADSGPLSLLDLELPSPPRSRLASMPGDDRDDSRMAVLPTAAPPAAAPAPSQVDEAPWPPSAPASFPDIDPDALFDASAPDPDVPVTTTKTASGPVEAEPPRAPAFVLPTEPHWLELALPPFAANDTDDSPGEPALVWLLREG